MQPWKISVGFTVIIIAVAAMIGGEHFAFLEPHFQILFPIIGWPSVVWRTCHSHGHGSYLRFRPRFGLG